MTVDRDQIRREAERALTAWGEIGIVRDETETMAHHCLALLEELQQAERASWGNARTATQAADNGIALAKVLREIANMDPPVIAVVDGALAKRVRDVLAAWDAEGC